MLDIKNRETLEIYVLGDDFKFYQNLKYLPLTSYPSNNQSALIIYCLGGKAKITVHEDVHWIQPEELIILLPGQFVSFSEPSEDFSTVTMVISTSLFSDALSGVPRFSPHFFFYMRTHYWYPQSERDIPRIYNYLGMIKDKVTSQDIYRRELIISLNIQEIAIKTNFANQSSLGRFFRKHTGMSLSQYRMSNLEQ